MLYEVITVVLGAVAVAVWLVYSRLPSSFLPLEDQGSMMAMIELPDSATMQQTIDAVAKVEDYLLNEEKDTMKTVFTALGFSFSGSSQNSAMIFAHLKDYDERPGLDSYNFV